MSTRALIVGCAGLQLTEAEQEFLADVQPWGLILFKRNIQSPEQVSALTREFRRVVGYHDAPVLIDQEGGRVQRLTPPHWPDFPPASKLEEAYLHDNDRGIEATRLGARLIASELLALGITIDCMPVADVRFPDGHGVIGDRAYSAEIDTVVPLARAAADGLADGGVLPVVKHIPGHGRANVDSHETLPVVSSSREELDRTDFEPFRLLNDLPIAMTAHVVYKSVDPNRAATVSPIVIQDVVRGHIGFDGLLLTDDISMKALKGDLRGRAQSAIGAGCDIILHCNGNLDEMKEVATASPKLAGKSAARANAALDRRKTSLESMNVAEARARFSAMITA